MLFGKKSKPEDALKALNSEASKGKATFSFSKKESEPSVEPDSSKVKPKKSMLDLFKKKENLTATTSSLDSELTSEETQSSPVSQKENEAPVSPKTSFLSKVKGASSKSSEPVSESASSLSTVASKKKSKTPQIFGPMKEVILQIELENGRLVFWKMSESGLEQISDDHKIESAFSFSREDFRFWSDLPISDGKGDDVALQEIGEAVRTVNKTKALSAVYACRAERVDGKSLLLSSGQQVLDKILHEAKLYPYVGDETFTGKHNLICGFLFQGVNARGQNSTLGLIYHYDDESESTKVQISVNPDNMDWVIKQFATAHRIKMDDTDVVIFDNSDFLKWASSADAYPNEPVWHGITVRKLYTGLMIGAGIFCGGSVFWTATGYTLNMARQSEAKSLSAEVESSQSRLSDLVSQSARSFAKKSSIDISDVFEKSEKVWIPGSKVTLEATPASDLYSVSLVILKSRTTANRASSIGDSDSEDISNLLSIKAPEGCEKSSASISGRLNEIKIFFNCQNSNTDFSSMWIK